MPAPVDQPCFGAAGSERMRCRRRLAFSFALRRLARTLVLDAAMAGSWADGPQGAGRVGRRGSCSGTDAISSAASVFSRLSHSRRGHFPLFFQPPRECADGFNRQRSSSMYDATMLALGIAVFVGSLLYGFFHDKL